MIFQSSLNIPKFPSFCNTFPNMSNKSSQILIRSSKKCFRWRKIKIGKVPNLEILKLLVRDYYQIKADGFTTGLISSNARDQCETGMRSLHTPESFQLARLILIFSRHEAECLFCNKNLIVSLKYTQRPNPCIYKVTKNLIRSFYMWKWRSLYLYTL